MMYREAQMNDGSDLGGQTGGDQVTDWRESVPEQYRGWDEVKNSDSPEKLWDQMANMRSRMGRSIQIPSDDASDEDRLAAMNKVHERFPELIRAPDRDDAESINGLMKSLGKPDEAIAYQMPDMEVPEGVNGMSEDDINAVKGIFFEAGATQKQFEQIFGQLASADIQRQVDARNQAAESVKTMRGEWGQAYEQNVAMAVRHAEQLGFDENTIKALRDGRMPAQNVKAFYTAAKQSGETPAIAAQGEGSSAIMTPDEAQQRMDDIRNKIYQGRQSGVLTAQEERRLVKQMEGYIKYAYPESEG